MFTRTSFAVFLMASSCSFAQAPPEPEQSEAGAVNIYAEGGPSIGLPASRADAFILAPNGSILAEAVSPYQTTLGSASLGATVTAWKFLAPLVDLTIFDRGKATATAGPISATSEDQGNTFALNAGMRMIAGKNRVRGFFEIAGGLYHQSTKNSFAGPALVSSPSSAAFSTGSVMYGTGLQFFATRKLGFEMGVNGFHVGKSTGASGSSISNFALAGQNFAQIRFGVFFQTKSAIR
jgi:hypothetical protein